MKFILILIMLCFNLNAEDISIEQLKILEQIAKRDNLKKEKISFIDKKQTITNNILKNDNNLTITDINKTKKIKENQTEENQTEENPFFYKTNLQKLQKSKNIDAQIGFKSLNRFGKKFFENNNKLNPYSLPTPSNYILSKGDKVSVSIYDKDVKEYELLIDRDGKITIPRVGKIRIIGLNYEEAKNIITKECAKAFPTNNSIFVDLVEYNTIQVTISGFVNAPGLYNLSSFSSIKDALIISGGILEQGSYREILLKRDNKVIIKFDLYSLIRYGNSDSDTVLKSGDVIVVTPIKKVIALKGEVEVPALYELKDNERYSELFKIAIGLNPNANKNNIKLKRYLNNNESQISILNLNQLYNIAPQNGDEIEIFPLSLLSTKSLVNLKGNIVAPGERSIPRNKSLTTLLKIEISHVGKKGLFLDDTNYNYGVVKNDNRVVSFNLRNVIRGIEDVELKEGDTVYIFNKNQTKENPYIYANGIVVNPNKRKYQYYEGMRVKDLFKVVEFRSDILIDDNETITHKNITTNKETKFELKSRVRLYIDKNKIQLKRLENSIKKVFTIDINKNPDFKLLPFDEITFFNFDNINDKNEATIAGEVFIPGTYPITQTTTINDLIKKAGGLTKKAILDKFELIKYYTENNYRKRGVQQLSLKEAIANNIKIDPDDEIRIFPVANWSEKKYVTIKGAIKFPGTYAIENGEQLSSLIKRAGGFLDNAFIEGAVFTREEIRKKQEKQMKEIVEKLKIKSLQLATSASSFGENSEDKVNMISAIKSLENQASEIKPIGRISIKLSYDVEKFKQSNYDLTLKEDDGIFIPTMDDTVTVLGEVLSPNTFVYEPNKTVKDYLANAGDLNENADDGHIYIVKANGEAKRYKEGYFFSDKTEIFKGDTIVVPLKIDTLSNLKMAKDISSIVYQLAITVASLHTVGAL